ncbi:MAG: polymerase subunit epsilon [Gammaproteobacteria bacterium]|jgi:DNA polymerase-3 subunit epsilon|nr:polymerase subunit epsilon [Gammaproteobacteria bacterium]
MCVKRTAGGFKMRQIALDTETTGLEYSKGHRIIEIGCIEIINRRITDNHFHCYINPERPIEKGAEAVHGLTQAFLADKPLFRSILPQFIEYLKGADEIIIHNAPFDTGFIDHEFKQCQSPVTRLMEYAAVIDTLEMARRLHPGQKNSLDALCKRYAVNNKHRTLHGALVDADLLARIYLAMTGGQESLWGDLNEIPSQEDKTVFFPTLDKADKINIQDNRSNQIPLTVIYADTAEVAAHEAYLSAIRKDKE